MATPEQVTELVDEIALMIAERIENGAIDLGIDPGELMDRVATEVKAMIEGWN